MLTACVPGGHGGEKSVSSKLELQRVVNHRVGLIIEPGFSHEQHMLSTPEPWFQPPRGL